MADLKDISIRELKEALHCPSCSGEIVVVKDVQNPQPLKKGNIVVCGHCATICKIGDSDLLKMTKEEVGELDSQSRSLLAIMCAGVASEIAKRRSSPGGGIN